MKNISRRTAIKTVLAGSAAMAVSGMEAAAPAKKKKVEKPEPLKGTVAVFDPEHSLDMLLKRCDSVG